MNPFSWALWAALLLPLQAASPVTVVENGRSAYSIVIAPDASASVKRGAEELQRFVAEISGARLPIATAATPRMILLGDSAALRTLRFRSRAERLGAEGYALETSGDHLIIAGSQRRGALYGVYGLLEKLGCRWFTVQLSRIPRQPTIQFESLYEVRRPAFEYRETYYTEALDRDWAARNRINGFHMKLDASTGGKMEYYPFVHSFYQLVSPKDYFATHPEYFSLVDGKRRGEAAQLCLTNPDVFRIALTSVEKWIQEHPTATIFTVSQNDYEGRCECDRCRRVEREEGGVASGPILRFTNAIAAAIAKKHPGKLIDTLAYDYSEEAPAKVKPLPNVRVRLCRFHACEGHPVASCPRSRAFYNNLRAWSRITRQIYVWHYNTNFAHYLQPFPDFDSLAADLPVYRDNGVVGLFMQGSVTRGGQSENAELRAYVISKLLWDPSQDARKLIEEFHEAFYGPAAPAMLAYWDWMHARIRQGDHLWIYSRTDSPHLTGEFLAKAAALFDQAAAAAASDPVISERIRRARRSITYMEIVRAKRYQVRDGWYQPTDLEGVRARWDSFVAGLRATGVTNLQEVPDLDADDAAVHKNLRPYRIVTLENERSVVHVAPELRGRVTHWIDKRTGANLLREPDFGTTAYPDAHGGAVRLSDGYERGATLKVEWQLEPSPDPKEIRLAGRTTNGLLVRRRLWLEGDVLRTIATLENTSRVPAEAMLHTRWDFRPAPIDELTIRFQSQDGTRTDRPIIRPGDPVSGELHGRPAGQWDLRSTAGALLVSNRFDTSQVAKAAATWLVRSDYVGLELSSSRAILQPGAQITLISDYRLP